MKVNFVASSYHAQHSVVNLENMYISCIVAAFGDCVGVGEMRGLTLTVIIKMSVASGVFRNPQRMMPWQGRGASP